MAQTKSAAARKKVSNHVRSRSKQEFGGFVEFVRSQGVVGLAIGFVMGAQAKVLIDQFTASFINPLVGLFLSNGQNLSSQTITVIIGSRTAVFAWGAFASTLINFIIIAAVIYFTFKWLRLEKLDKPKA